MSSTNATRSSVGNISISTMNSESKFPNALPHERSPLTRRAGSNRLTDRNRPAGPRLETRSYPRIPFVTFRIRTNFQHRFVCSDEQFFLYGMNKNRILTRSGKNRLTTKKPKLFERNRKKKRNCRVDRRCPPIFADDVRIERGKLNKTLKTSNVYCS